MNLLQYTMGQMNIEQNNPLVSVIIPTNNRFHSLINAINSVINQTYRPIQLIIVNDGADDQKYYDYNFQELVKNEKDIELIMFQHKFSSKEKFGYNCSAYPRNTGINLSRGKYVAFLDDNHINFIYCIIYNQILKLFFFSRNYNGILLNIYFSKKRSKRGITFYFY